MGAYDKPTYTVEELVQDPTMIPNYIKTELDHAFLENLIFRQAEPNRGVVGYSLPGPVTLDGDAETVAEFGEFPFRDADTGEEYTLTASKYGVGIRISFEEVNENRLSRVQKKLVQQMNTVLRFRYRAMEKALKGAQVQTMAASTQWGKNADVWDDLLKAAQMVASARPEGTQDQTYEYVADTVIMHGSTYIKLLSSQSVKDIFQGNVASENPVFKGLKPQKLGDFLQVATDPRMPVGEVWVLESGTVGFSSDTVPLTVDELDVDRRRQCYETLVWGKRALAVDNPKALVKITGV